MGQQSYLIYQAKVGDTPKFYDDCTASVGRYCERFGFTHLVQTEPRLKISPFATRRSANANRLGYLPIYEKENAFGYFDQFEKILILDADIYIRDSAPNIFAESDTDFAGVIEREMPLTAKYFEKIRKPFPLFSASLPSGLKIRSSNSLLLMIGPYNIPSEPTP